MLTAPEPPPVEGEVLQPPPFGRALFLNLVVVGVLTFLISREPLALPACQYPAISALSWAVILVMLGQLIWRSLRVVMADLAGSLKMSAVEIPLKVLVALFETLHLVLLSDRALALLAFCVFGLVGIFGLSPLSPFRPPEPTPVIQSFTVQFADGSMRSYKPGDELEIEPNQQVLVEATIDQENTPCTWSAVYGSVPSDRGCSTLYRLPFGQARDNLTLLAQSPCSTRQAFAGLSIVAARP
ncbi:MAG TPA: hypothetical protein VJG32_14415 [Anaerolineae bacterium]|nr:hypothetical protein [Anaerolineae bacterium]